MDCRMLQSGIRRGPIRCLLPAKAKSGGIAFVAMAGSEVDMLWTELLLVLTEVGSTAAKKAIVAWQRGLPQVLDGTLVLEGEHPFGLEVPCWKGTVAFLPIEGCVCVLHVTCLHASCSL